MFVCLFVCLFATNQPINQPTNKNRAKNVIMFLGDGMGLPTVAATRVYRQQGINPAEKKNYLFWESFPNLGLARTYNVDHSTPDSAGTATAYLSGIKANLGTIGVTEYVQFKKCSNMTGNRVESIVHKSIKEGKSTGIVTTTRITHASPAGCYASTPCRDWEDRVPDDATDCTDIAQQLILDDRNKDIKVILGGGLKYFLPDSYSNSTPPKVNGTRKDGKNLIQSWESYQTNQSRSYKLVFNKQALATVDAKNTDYLLGLFNADHMSFDADRSTTDEPSLADMTSKAIEILKKNDKGYFLFVEGCGKIDHAHHNTNAYRALIDTLAFEKAIESAYNNTSPDDTLILVTADHSHVFSFGGYGLFEESVLGYASSVEPSLDGMPYLQMAYSNGPGYKVRRNLTGNNKDAMDKDFVQETAVWLAYETHGGEDVPVYASGPWSHLFRSTEEQNYVAHVMMYASCVGDYTTKEHCVATANNGAGQTHSFWAVSVIILSNFFYFLEKF
ncbi:hypothetical protein HELRODRAFT_67985 [Helobdella robusta]|uniref:alkaline phosphatase n=1 Tax=Helobdella robusta TaxID=6412 RepID=T1FZ90_HELRO|nr:hypothetical protein HELRODRAFT_67985 [Helobdella robusta]ESN96160.1 hypothetical protein HELRODRAFT_67985 [Helobdella robusta]